MIKKVKKLIEIIVNMNFSYVKFLKQVIDNLEINFVIKLRQFKVFKFVLVDIKKVYFVLEEDLNSEIRVLDVVNKEKNIKEYKVIDGKFEIKVRKGEKFFVMEKKDILKLEVKLLRKQVDSEYMDQSVLVEE